MQNTSSCSIVTLNVRSLRDPTKRRAVYTFLRHLSVDIICLQETHTPAEEAAFWTQQWQGPAVWTEHTGILVASQHTLTSHSISEQGRVLQADTTIKGCRLTIANIYAPAQRTPRRAFFNRLAGAPFDPAHIHFIASDWNAYPDPEVDRDPRFLPAPTLRGRSWPRHWPTMTMPHKRGHLTPFSHTAIPTLTQLASITFSFPTCFRMPHSQPQSTHSHLI
jgi:hypothetical protein